jgi:hypothetical protein
MKEYAQLQIRAIERCLLADLLGLDFYGCVNSR